MKPQKLDLLICRMAYDGYENSKLVNWLVGQTIWLHTHPAVGDVYHTEVTRKAPVARARNLAAQTALKLNADILVMVDHDIIPSSNWLRVALALIQEHRAEGRRAIVAAPAVCDDGKTNVAVYKTPVLPGGFQWDGPTTLHRHGVTEASLFGGVGDAAAVGTGCIAIDCDVLRVMKTPWFALEYADEEELEISTGEDIYFTRNAAQDGVAINVTWDEWAVHKKQVDLVRPEPIDPFTIPFRYREAVGMLADNEQGVPS
jgi:hypothetical protein